MKTATIGDFLTDQDVKQVKAIWRATRGPGGFIKRVVSEVLEPNMARINASLGQENNATYLAYAIEYAMTQAERAQRA